MTLFKGSIVALLLSSCKFQTFIISFLSENQSMSLAKVTSEHELYKPVTEQGSSELTLAPDEGNNLDVTGTTRVKYLKNPAYTEIGAVLHKIT